MPLALPILRAADLSVLDVTEYFAEGSGGIRTYLLEKGRYVSAREGLRQVLVVPGERAARSELAAVRRYDLYGPRIPGQPPYRFLLDAPALARIVRDERPDLVEVGSPGLVPWVARLATRREAVPLVWFYHSNFPRLFSPHGADERVAWRARAAYAYLGRLGRRFAATLATSAFSEADLARAGVPNVRRVSLGVDLERFHPRRRAARAATRERLGLGEEPLFLYTGRFAREKELDVLLAAWPAVERAGGAVLALAGAGPHERRLRALAGPRVRWIPFERDRERLAELYAAADAYVAPCPVESFGIAALEAQACGVPVLCADRGGVAERVARCGGGLAFPSGDPAGLAAAALELLRADRDALGRLARADAEREHDWERVFERIFEVYREVLAEHRAR